MTGKPYSLYQDLADEAREAFLEGLDEADPPALDDDDPDQDDSWMEGE